VAEVRPALRVLKALAQAEVSRVSRAVAEVRPALRVLKAGLSATYNNNIERWQRFDPL